MNSVHSREKPLIKNSEYTKYIGLKIKQELKEFSTILQAKKNWSHFNNSIAYYIKLDNQSRSNANLRKIFLKLTYSPSLFYCARSVLIK